MYAKLSPDYAVLISSAESLGVFQLIVLFVQLVHSSVLFPATAGSYFQKTFTMLVSNKYIWEITHGKS